MHDRDLTPDELDRLIDGLLAGASEEPSERRRRNPMLIVAEDVRALAHEPVPPRVRERHVTMIRSALDPQAPTTSGSSWTVGLRRRAAAIVTAASLAFTAAGGGAVAVAQDAEPGDALYGLKRASESVALAVASDEARLHLRFAERRLDELEERPDHAAELAPEAARQFDLAQDHGAELGDAGAEAVARLSAILSEGQLGSDNAAVAVSRACNRIAERNPNVTNTCAHDGRLPGDSGDAPGRQGDRPGHSGDAPGRQGGSPGTGGDASGTTDEVGSGSNDAPGPPDGDPGRSDGEPGRES